MPPFPADLWPFLRLAPFLRPHAGAALRSAAAAALAAGAAALFPWALKGAADAVLGSPAGWAALAGPCALVLAAALARALAAARLRSESSALGEAVGADLRRSAFRALVTADLARVRVHHSGEMVSRALQDASALRQVLVEGTRGATLHAVSLVASGTLLVTLSPRLSLVPLALLPPLALVSRRSAAALRRSGEASRAAQDGQSRAVAEAVALAPLVRLTAAADRLQARFEDHLARDREAVEAAHRERSRLQTAHEVLGALATVALLALGAREVAAGRLSAGGLLGFVFYARMAQASLAGLQGAWALAQHASGAARRFLDLAPAPAPPAPPGPGRPAAGPDGGLHARGLRYAWPGGPEVVAGLSLDLRAGGPTFLEGASGSGKSTLVALLAGLAAPSAGEVRLDARPVRALEGVERRRSVGVLTQEAALLDGTVAENLRLGDPEAPDAALREALEAVGLWTALGRGLETRVGEGGSALSRGERQRVGVARLLLQDPAVVLADEPVASLDAEAADRVLGLLYAHFGARTLLVTGHAAPPEGPWARVLRLEAGRVWPQEEAYVAGTNL
ncbi:MAG: ABC transporter ATP-binding protein [Planctomycetes bacterium]|nr:ABC transporter ATP-binding protein [Planctomycetota bacterium]